MFPVTWLFHAGILGASTFDWAQHGGVAVSTVASQQEVLSYVLCWHLNYAKLH